MNKIIGKVDSWNGSNFSNTITLKIEECDPISLSNLVGKRVEIELKEKTTEPTLPELTNKSLTLSDEQFAKEVKFAKKQGGVKNEN